MIEGLLVFITHGVNAWTIVVLGAIALASLFVYRLARERTNSELLHEITWLIAASQLGATLAVSAGYIIKGALVVLIVLFALVALGLLLLERS